MIQIGGDTDLNHSHIKTEIMSRDRMNSSVIDNAVRTPESHNSPNSHKTMVRMSNPQKI